MRVLSKAFSRLKTTLPWVPPDTKLSKLDTLRLAASYIGHLQAVLDGPLVDRGEATGHAHPVNLTWPFTFNGRTIGGLGPPASTSASTAPATSITISTNGNGDSSCSNISNCSNISSSSSNISTCGSMNNCGNGNDVSSICSNTRLCFNSPIMISNSGNNNIIGQSSSSSCDLYIDNFSDERKPRFEDSLISSHN